MSMAVLRRPAYLADEDLLLVSGIEVTPGDGMPGYGSAGSLDAESDPVWEAGQLPSWIVDTLRQLADIAQLPENWDSYGARPVRHDTLDFSVRMLCAVERDYLPVPHVTAGSSGSVGFEWHVGGRDLEIEVYGTERLEYLKEYPDGNMEEGEFSSHFPEELRRLIRWLLHGND